ncbi:MAG: hypothetical protein V4667_06775 [Bacteroidota bacterium]
MKFDTKGSKSLNYSISKLELYLKNVSSDAKWLYSGLIVEIDPTIDYSNSNVLIRWTDIDEEFNDKIIINSLKQFKTNFRIIN